MVIFIIMETMSAWRLCKVKKGNTSKLTNVFSVKRKNIFMSAGEFF
jgi:hypothetical protein